jgi:hypothetical protein
LADRGVKNAYVNYYTILNLEAHNEAGFARISIILNEVEEVKII